MKISVITVSYNSATTIVDTVESALGQNGVDIEYLVMDGGSTDDTLAKLEPYRDRIDVLISEPDKGMYDAMNKGVARAKGDVVGILNSDDFYADFGVLPMWPKHLKTPASTVFMATWIMWMPWIRIKSFGLGARSLTKWVLFGKVGTPRIRVSSSGARSMSSMGSLILIYRSQPITNSCFVCWNGIG